MKILNLIWGFALGAGIDKCFMTYAGLGEVDDEIVVKSVCVNILSLNSHIEPLKKIGAQFIDIKNKRDYSWLSGLKHIIEEEKPDLVFTHGFNGAIMMLLERLFKGVKLPVVCSYHGLYHAPTGIKKLIAPLFNFLPLFYYRHFASRVICVENFSRQYLCERGVPAERVVTVHNGLDEFSCIKPDDTTLVLSKESPLIITASRITEVKGLTYLLDALRILKDRGVSFHYYMLGEGSELDMLKDKSKWLGLDDRIDFAGYQDNVTKWLNQCDIFALPSLAEYHSIALLEAMRAGKAIVATRVGGNEESVTDGVEALMVPAADPESLAEALQILLTDAELRQRLGANARQRYEMEFTERAMMTNLVKALRL